MSLFALIPTILDAGAAIMDIYGRDIAVAHKGDQSPVTEADQLAETLILAGLTGLFPDVPVVAEESVAAGLIPAIADRFFLVDPLDGTKEFISKNGEFTVNIGLIDKGVPVGGLVYAPALNRIYGGDENGAWVADVDKGVLKNRQSIQVRPAPKAITAVGSRSHGSAETEAFLARFAVETFKPAGSSLKFCLIAEGKADIYPRMGRTMQWDTAAAHAVLRAAGGEVYLTDLKTPLPYGLDAPANADFSNAYFVAVGDKGLI